MSDSTIAARDTTKSNLRFSSSTRAFTVSTFFSPIFSAMSAQTFIFFPMLSRSVNFTSGNIIANGMPGKPPPVPRSITQLPGVKEMNLAIASECRM